MMRQPSPAEPYDSLPASSPRPLLSGIRPVGANAAPTSILWAPALVLAALWALTALSLDLASRSSPGLGASLAIPSLQAALIGVCFMRVTRERSMHWVLLGVAAFLAAALFCLSLFDLTESRTQTPQFDSTGN